MKTQAKFLITAFILMILLAPAFSFAQGNPTPPSDPDKSKGLVQCGRSVYPPGTKDANGRDVSGQTIQCGFKDFMALVNRFINFILFTLALPIAAIMFAYAGFLLVTAGGEAAHARTKAKSIFTHAALGLIIAAAAWLIVKTVLVGILGYTDAAWIGF